MSAFFIKKSGQYYMRLTGNTTQVKFAAVSESSASYTFYIAGTPYISKSADDFGLTYRTESARPFPLGTILDNARFPGTETTFTFPGSGTRDYLLSFISSWPGAAYSRLGGELVSAGIYAYPGSAYPSKFKSNAVELRNSNSWSANALYVRQSNTWQEVTNAWIRDGGIWKKFHQVGNGSSWFNMLSDADDALDVAIQVIPQITVTSLDSNTGNFTRSLTVPSSNANSSWSQFMKDYAVWPYPGQVNVGITYSSTWTVNIEVSGNYVLRLQGDNTTEIFFNGVSIATTGNFYPGGETVITRFLSKGTYSIYVTIINEFSPTDTWDANPAGTAWSLSGPV